MTTLGSELASLRHAAGATQQRVAELAGVSTATVSLIERGRIDPRSSTVEKIRAAIQRASPVRATGIQPATVRRADRRKSGV